MREKKDLQPGRELDRQVALVMGQAEFAHDFYKETETQGPYGFEGVVNHCSKGCEVYGEVENFDDDDKLCCPLYSTDMNAAMVAFEWLEKKHPWGLNGATLLLGRLWVNSFTRLPHVIVMRPPDVWEAPYHLRPWVHPGDRNRIVETDSNFAFEGETYPHAICLAVLEAVKQKQVDVTPSIVL